MYKLTRGIRNKNPMNIRFNASNSWDGQTGYDDAGFSIFSDSKYGIRAGAKLLQNYQRKYELMNVFSIIERWAPDSENDTQSYIENVSSKLGVTSLQHIDLINDKEMLRKLVAAIIHHENGLNPYSDSAIDDAIALI